MQKWEYKELEYPYTDVEYLNDLGDKGWELVAAPCDDTGQIKRLIFKRPK